MPAAASEIETVQAFLIVLSNTSGESTFEITAWQPPPAKKSVRTESSCRKVEAETARSAASRCRLQEWF